MDEDTEPRDWPPMSQSLIHPKAQAFDAAAGDYAAGRPDYPEGIVEWLRRDLELGPGRRVIDLGAGTGKFTARLRATGADILAVEPVAGMRSHLAAAFPQVSVVDGAATAIPAPDGWADAVVSAQAFHWFAHAAALDEIARVLRPGGALGLVWNTRDDRAPWVARLTAILDAYEGDAPRHADGQWRSAFPHPAFGPLHERSMGHVHTGDPEAVIVRRVTSVSFIAALPETEKAKVVEAVRAVIASEPDLAGRAMVTFPYETRAYWTRKA